MQGGPAEARSHGGLIEFALDHELRASIIKTEDLVVEIETIHDKAQATRHSDAALSIDLEARTEVVIAERSSDPTRGPIRESRGRDVRSVIRQSDTNRNAGAVRGW